MIDKIFILNEIKASYKCKNDASFAKFLGISPQTLATWYHRNTFNIELLYSRCPDINADFLLSGVTPVLKSKFQEQIIDSRIHEPCPNCIEKERLVEAMDKVIEALNKVVDAQNITIQSLRQLNSVQCPMNDADRE